MSAIDPYLRRIRKIIRSRGWVIQFIMPGPQSPPFHYTVGLWPKVGFEIIVIGLPREIGQSVLNDLASRAVDGTRFTHGQILTDVLGNDYDVTMLEVTDSRTWIKVANRLYRRGDEPLRAWQMVYPDAAHRMPWDPGYTSTGPPVLGQPPNLTNPGNPPQAPQPDQ